MGGKVAQPLEAVMSIKVGRLMGVPVQIHITWFAGFFLLTYIIAQSLYISLLSSIAIGSLIVALLYACIIAHECAHAFATQMWSKDKRNYSFCNWQRQFYQTQTCWADELRCIGGANYQCAIALVFAMFVFVFAQSILLTNILLFLHSNALLAIINIPGFPLMAGVCFGRFCGVQRAIQLCRNYFDFVGKAIGAIIAVCGSVLCLRLIGMAD